MVQRDSILDCESGDESAILSSLTNSILCSECGAVLTHNASGSSSPDR